jgi:hypothetical protein
MKTKATTIHVKRVNLTNLISFSSPSDKGVFTRYVKVFDLSATQNQEIKQLCEAVDAKGLVEQETQHYFDRLDQLVKSVKKQLPSNVKAKVKVLKKLQTSLSLSDGFKASLPLLSYLTCLNTDGGAIPTALAEIWLELKSGGSAFGSIGSRGLEDADGENTPVRVVAGVTIYKTPAGAYQFTCGTTICIDGAPTAYGPNDSGQDLTRNAGHNKGDVKTWKKDTRSNFLKDESGNKIPATFWEETDWFGVATGEDGKPILKPDGYYVSVSSYNYTGFTSKGVQDRYVNADIISYAVLSRVSAPALGLKIGDLVYIKNLYKGKNKGKWAGFLETRRADDKIGEMSVAAADAIGVPSSPRNGGQDGDIQFTFYPNTGPNYHFKNDKEAAYYIFWNGKNIDEGKPVNRDLRLAS